MFSVHLTGRRDYKIMLERWSYLILEKGFSAIPLLPIRTQQIYSDGHTGDKPFILL